MSIGDIEVILNPITERYFGKSGMCMKDIYSEILKLEMPQLAGLQADLQEKCTMAQNSFQDAAEKDKDALQTFALICMLSMDVFTKKLLIERMVDELSSQLEKEKGETDKKENKKKPLPKKTEKR